MAVDEGKLMEFLGQFVGDLGATASAGSVVLGDHLGLYRALAAVPGDAGPAGRAHRHERAVRHGVAAWPGRWRLCHVRRCRGDVLAHRGAGVRAHRPRRTRCSCPGRSSSRSAP